jgi:hypothetical protein
MILSLVSVGEKYIDHCLPHVERFKNSGWEVHILTDNPNRFSGCEVKLYENKIFSYFDKILFTLRLSEKFKEGVLFVDSDWIHNISDEFISTFKGSDKFLYYDNWPNGETFKDYIKDPYFFNQQRFWEKNNFIYDNLITILEWVFYIPHTTKISDIIYDLEHIKPVFEYNSVMVDAGYSGIGNGEGLGLSYSLHKNNIKIKKFGLV